MKYFVKLGLIILAVIFGVWFVGATLIHSHDTEVNTEIAFEHPEITQSVSWSESHSTHWTPNTGIDVEEDSVSRSNKPDSLYYN